MREGEFHSPKTRQNNRTHGYRSRPIARIQPRYRTNSPHKPIAPVASQASIMHTQQLTVVEGFVQTPQAATTAFVKTTPKTENPGAYPQPKILSQQSLTKPAHIQRVSLEKPRTTAKHTYRSSHVVLPNVPTLPLGRRSVISKAVGRVKRMPKQKKRAYTLMTIAIMLITLGSFVNANNALVVKKIEAQMARGDGAANTTSSAGSSVVYSEIQPDVTMMGKYTTAPDLPKYLTINSLTIWSRVTKVAVDAKGQIGVPKNIFDTGWYDGSVKPGQPGTVVIDGHMIGPTKAGSFIDLSKIKPGAFVSVTTGDNTQYVYRVASAETIAASAVTVQKLLSPYGSAAQSLVLTARDGTSLKNAAAPEMQTIVYAVRQY